MNEEASQREQEEYAQFEAEQEELREIACAKYEDYKPLLDEMIKHSLDIGQIDMYELLIDDRDKLEKYMSESEWQEAIKFDSTDVGWVIMSIGMAIGAGIVFLPVQVGLMGLWVFLLSSIVGYPAMYLFQRLFINTLAESPECKDYPSVISGYLGKNWGILLGALYFIKIGRASCRERVSSPV